MLYRIAIIVFVSLILCSGFAGCGRKAPPLPRDTIAWNAPPDQLNRQSLKGD